MRTIRLAFLSLILLVPSLGRAEPTYTGEEVSYIAFIHDVIDAACELIDLYRTVNLSQVEVYECLGASLMDEDFVGLAHLIFINGKLVALDKDKMTNLYRGLYSITL